MSYAKLSEHAFGSRKIAFVMKKRRSPGSQPRSSDSRRQPNATAQGQYASLKAALSMHQRGLLDQAAVIYRELLHSQPRNFDALQLLATIAVQRGNFAGAVELFDKAIKINATDARTHYNRGVALCSLERFGEAIESCDRALRIRSDYVEAHNSRGIALRGLKRFEESYRATTEL